MVYSDEGHGRYFLKGRVMLSLSKSPLVMLVAPIGQSEPWELTPFGGKVRCTPVSKVTDDDSRPHAEYPVLLLSDWGFLDGGASPHARRVDEVWDSWDGSVNFRGSDIVLLVSTAVIPLLASLRARAAEGDHTGDDPLRRDDWCAVWPHFVTTHESVHALLRDVVTQHTCGSVLVPTARSRRYVYGSLPGDVSPVPLVRPTAPRADAARCRVPANDRADVIEDGHDVRRRREQSQYASWTPTVFESSGASLARDVASASDESAR